MKKRDKKNSEFTREDHINSQLARMRHRDLQRECVLRGLEFKDVVGFSHHALAGWFVKNFENGPDNNRLIEFDLWAEKQLQERGYKKGDAAMAPSFRFSYIPEESEITTKITNAPKPEKAAKKLEEPKRKKDEKFGVAFGTKKHLTFEYVNQGKTLEETQNLVRETFPDANDASMLIWYRKALKQKRDAAKNNP